MDNLWILPILLTSLDKSKFAIPLYINNYRCYYRYGGGE